MSMTTNNPPPHTQNFLMVIIALKKMRCRDEGMLWEEVQMWSEKNWQKYKKFSWQIWMHFWDPSFSFVSIQVKTQTVADHHQVVS